MDAAKTWAYLVYWIVLIASCTLAFFNLEPFNDILRMLLMPFLAIYMFLCMKPTHSDSLKIYFSAALAFSCIGDITRILDSTMGLIAMCISYSIANIFLALSFLKIRPVKINKAVYANLAIVLGAVVIYFLFFKAVSASKIGHQKAPYIINMLSEFIALSFAANIIDSNSRKKLAFNYFLPAIGLSIAASALYVWNKYMVLEPRLYAFSLMAYGYSKLLCIDGFRKTSK